MKNLQEVWGAPSSTNIDNSSLLHVKPFEIQRQSTEKRQNVESAIGKKFSIPTISLKWKSLTLSVGRDLH